MTLVDPAMAEAEGQLAALASGLCLDAGIRIEVAGDRWAYDPLRNVLRVAATALARFGRDYCAGRLTNEVGHYWLTRHDLFPVRFPSERAARIVLDALDDGRVDSWMVARYPGCAEWLGRVAELVDGPPHKPLPLVLLFARECALEPARGWAPAPYPVPFEVADALDRTRDARRAYAAIAPSTLIGDAAPDALLHYQDHVSPQLLRTTWAPTPYEADTRAVALMALELAETEVLPAAAALMEHDIQLVERWLCCQPLEHQRLRDGMDPNTARRAWEQAQRGSPANPSPHPQAHATASEVLENLLKGQTGHERVCEGCGPPRPAPPGASRRPVRVRPGDGGGWGSTPTIPMGLPMPPQTPYNEALSQMASQIARLVTLLERVLKPRQRLRSRAGYPSGREVDLRSLMRFEADPKLYDRLWTRTTIPERRRVAFSLLVDLSGSMEGEKTHAALLGTVLMAETLARLQVPFAINGFQDVIIPFSAFHEPFGHRVREAIASMPGEVSATRPGGNNSPGHNDDGPCVMDAANELLAESVEERVLLVVSDGQPAGSRSTEQDLYRTIAQLTAPGVPIELLGIGLGPGTEHVATYYPQSVASVPLAKFADEIGRLIARGLRVSL